jgi:hypothetical protein
MAGFFQNLRLVSERNDMDAPASTAYETTTPSTNVAQSSTEQITPEGTQSNVLTIQPIPQGFGAYLDGILPPDIAKAAGAFSVSMQQIKNISSVPIEKFAQVVNSLETTKGLNVNGTSVPTDTSLASQGLALIALGNGPFGTYTMSNFLGCMSGLPYLGINIRQLIQQLETSTLYDIYKNLYLAVTWELATVSVQYSTYQVETDPGPPPSYTTYYHVTGLTIVDPGGGYGREGAASPTITISNGGTGTTTIGTNYLDITNYGRVLSVSVSSAGSDSTSIPTATVSFPPGTGSFSNSIVQGYIDAANAEIVVIKNAQPARAQQLITNWENTGRLLTVEQRAIATGMALQVPLADPAIDREPTLAGYPTTQYSFVDSIPRYATFTQPHMYSQTLEAISNLNTVGGRSLVAMLREARNQARLQEAGIPLDNNIENKLTKTQEAELIGNGILPNSVPASNGLIPYPTPAPSTTNGTFVDTVPATLSTELGNTDPYGYYNPTNERYYNTNNNYLGSGQTNNIGQINVGGVGQTNNIGQINVGGVGQLVDIGEAIEPGSFAGSRYSNLISPELSVIYASDILLPATYSVQEAIDEVIRCNCDCWDNI